MKRKEMRISNSGISLLTALIALVLMALAMLGVAQVFLKAMENNGSSGGVTTLTLLAQQAAEKVMLLPDDPTVDTTGIMGGGGSTVDADTALLVPYDGNRFTVKVTSERMTAAVDDHLLKVTIAARYKNRPGQKRFNVDEAGSEVRLVTYRYVQ